MVDQRQRHSPRLKVSKKKKKRKDFSQGGNRKYLITAVKQWLSTRLLYRVRRICSLQGNFEVSRAKT